MVVIALKKVVLFSILLGLSAISYAQNDVTQFLGISIDGSKSEMIRKLKAKGYQTIPNSEDILTGEFNGKDVNIHVVTNNNKVWRIMVSDASPMSEGNIKIRLNNLCEQFKNNKRYMPASLSSDYTLSDNEDISYEMTVHNKRYEASYYQSPIKVDSIALAEEMQSVFFAKYTEEQLSNQTEEIKKDMMLTGLLFMLEKYSKNSVWFMINESFGKYYITMYYDNEYNKANGEDL